jgi:hypothetical protein
MADRNFPSHEIHNFQRDGVLICGHFSVDPVGLGIQAASRFGNGWTVAYTALGRFTVTTDETFHHIVAYGSQFCAATPTDQFTTADLSTGAAGAVVGIEINLWDAGAAALANPAAATDEFHFWMICSTSFADRAAW